MRIRFISKDNISGYYATADPEIQQGIESDSGFEKKFWLCEEFASKPVVEEIETTRYPEITTWQGAREILRADPYNVTSTELSTPAKIRSVAKKLSVAFPAIANF